MLSQILQTVPGLIASPTAQLCWVHPHPRPPPPPPHTHTKQLAVGERERERVLAGALVTQWGALSCRNPIAEEQGEQNQYEA